MVRYSDTPSSLLARRCGRAGEPGVRLRRERDARDPPAALGGEGGGPAGDLRAGRPGLREGSGLTQYCSPAESTE